MLKKLLIACTCVCLTAGALMAQEDAAAARKTLQTYEKGVITLSAVLKFELKAAGASMPNLERKTACLAAIIDTDGLAVTALRNINPRGQAQAQGRRIELESHVQEVKYRLADGTELPARVVLKDEDLDLAFLAPLEPLDEQTKAKIAAVPLDDEAPPPETLDAIIMIGRAGEDLNFAATLQLGHIAATISQPRTCYLGTIGMSGALVFNSQGKLLGIFCQCVSGGDGSGDTIQQLASKNLILPAAELARLVPQAKEEIGRDAEKKSDDESNDKSDDKSEDRPEDETEEKSEDK